MTAPRPYPSTARSFASLFAVAGWLSLALQLWLILNVSRADGQTTSHLIVNYFSFFTVLSNLLITAIYTWIALSPPGPSLNLQAAAASYIAVVGIGYSLLLRSTWNPQGLQKLLDVLLHDIMPFVYIVFWVLFSRSFRRLPWTSALTWLLPPLLYLLYSLLRGVVTGWYPYPFLDPRISGWPHVFIIIVGFLIAFLSLGLAAVSLTRPQPIADSAELPLT